MPTDLDIDRALLERAVAVSDERTKTAAVRRGLEELAARRERGRQVEIFGALDAGEAMVRAGFMMGSSGES